MTPARLRAAGSFAQNFQRRAAGDAAAEREAAENGEGAGGEERGNEQAGRWPRRTQKDEARQGPIRGDGEQHAGKGGESPSAAYSIRRIVRTCLRRGAERAQQHAFAQALLRGRCSSVPMRMGTPASTVKPATHGNDAGDFCEDAADGLEDEGQVDRGDVRKFLHERFAAARRRRSPPAGAWSGRGSQARTPARPAGRP